MYLNLRHIGIVVKNLDKNIKFFKKYFGFKIMNSQLEDGEIISKILKIKNLKVHTVKMIGKDGNKIELLKFIKPKEIIKKKIIYDTGITHFAVSVKNAEKIYKKFKKNKITCLSEPMLSKDKKAKLFFCKTPENVFLEIVEEKNK